MNVGQLIAACNRDYPNAVSNTDKVAYMNEAQQFLSPYFGTIIEDDSLTTVIAQDSYAFPTGLTDVYEIISLAIANQVTPASRYDYTQYHLSKSEENPMVAFSYYQIIDSTGAKKLAIFPAPTIVALKIVIRYRKKLTDLDENLLTANPEFDSRFHNILALYCCHKICASGSSPDTIQANMFMQKYDSARQEMRKFYMEQEKGQQKKGRDNKQWHRNSSFGIGY